MLAQLTGNVGELFYSVLKIIGWKESYECEKSVASEQDAAIG